MRKRTEKHRGSRTHGRGKKAGRGAGKRGGRGNAGLHKHNQMRMWKYDPDHFGRKGFKRDPSLSWKKEIANVGDVQSNLTAYLQTGVAGREGKTIIVDLTKTKIVKLLGAGTIKSPLVIKVYEATDRAKEKVKAAGGEVQLPFGTDDSADEELGEEVSDSEASQEDQTPVVKPPEGPAPPKKGPAQMDETKPAKPTPAKKDAVPKGDIKPGKSAPTKKDAAPKSGAKPGKPASTKEGNPPPGKSESEEVENEQ
jgi:large subunit ribosomal protein L15